jgi:beta-lactamase class A
MSHARSFRLAAMLSAAALGASALLASGVAPAATASSKPICTSAKHPKLAAHISAKVSAWLASRDDSFGLAVDATDGVGLTCKLNQNQHFVSASVIKATIISALLLKIGGPSHLTKKQRHLAWLMITESDDDAASDLYNEVGIPAMQTFLNKAGMRHTVLNVAWGLSLLTANDELTLLKTLTRKNRVLSTASRNYVLYLMANVVADQRWGVPAGAPSGVTVHVKNGWLPYPNNQPNNWHINSIGAFTGKHILYMIVVLTSGNPNEGYGIDTIQGAARVVNYSLAALPTK